MLDWVIFYIFGWISNEVVFFYQFFVWEYGINNFLDCFNMCYELSGQGLV